MSNAEKRFQKVDYTVDYKARYRTIPMKITDFLSMAKPGFDQSKADHVTELLEKGAKFESVPYLYFDLENGNARVTGHEGRHRARALLQLGYSTMPVELRGQIRWSEQTNPKGYDYIETWPNKLISEDGSKSINFPIPRDPSVAVKAYRLVTEPPFDRLVRLAERRDPYRASDDFMDVPLTAFPDGSTHVGSGVLFCCKATSRMLFVLRSKTSESPGTWCCIGGGVEPGETVEQGCRREVAEEARYTLPYSLIPMHKCVSDNYVFHNYFAFVDEEFVPALNEEHTEFVWSAELPQPIHPNFLKSLEAYETT